MLAGCRPIDVNRVQVFGNQIGDCGAAKVSKLCEPQVTQQPNNINPVGLGLAASPVCLLFGFLKPFNDINNNLFKISNSSQLFFDSLLTPDLCNLLQKSEEVNCVLQSPLKTFPHHCLRHGRATATSEEDNGRAGRQRECLGLQ